MTSNIPPGVTNVRRLDRSRLPDVLAFLRNQYGDDYYGADPRFFQWQYLDAPCDWFQQESETGDMPVNAALTSDGKILGLHAFVPFDAITPWGAQKGIWDEEWINGSGTPGLGRLLANTLRSSVDVYIGFGCNELSTAAFQKIGFEFVPEVPRTVCMLDPDRLHDLIAESGMAPPRFDTPTDEGLDSSFQVLPSTAALDHTLLDTYRRETTFGAGRSRAWLNWRYDRHPFIPYTVIGVGADGQDGAAVLRKEPVLGTDESVCRITDLFYRSGHESTLAKAIIAFARQQGCLMIDFISTSRKEITRLESALDGAALRFGSPKGAPYMFQPLALSAAACFNAIHFSQAPASIPVCLGDFRATKADSTQDILRILPKAQATTAD